MVNSTYGAVKQLNRRNVEGEGKKETGRDGRSQRQRLQSKSRATRLAFTVALLRPNGRFDCAGPVYFDLEIVCSTIFDSSLGIGNGTKERNTVTGT
jgi:hypothetical protein